MSLCKLNLKKIALVFLLIVCSRPALSKDKAAPGVASKSIGFELLDNRIFLDVKINGKGPYKFLFDTGGNNSMTFDLAKNLGLVVEDAGLGTGTGNGSQSIGKTKVQTFQVGTIKMKDQPFLVIDYSKIQKAFNLKALDGVFGLEILTKYVTYIDYENTEISFFTDRSEFNFIGYEIIDFILMHDKPFIQTKIDGLKANTLVDTGDRSALTVTKRFRKNHKINQPFVGKSEVITGYGIGGPIPAILARLNTFQLTHSSSLKKVMTRAPTTDAGFNADKNLDASIGNEILKQFKIVFDYQKHQIYIKKNKNFGLETVFTEVPNPQAR